MKTRNESERLAKTKSALAQKYDGLAAEAKSKPKRTQFMYKAERYRRQAAEVLRK